MLPDDEIHELGHEIRVPGAPIGVTEIRDEGEMKIPVSGVPRDAGNEPMLGKELLHVARTLGQALRRKTDVLRDERRAFRTILADQAQKFLWDVPGELDGLGDARELHRPDQPGATREFDHLALRGFERVGVLGADLDEQGSGIGIERLPVAGRIRKGVTGRSGRRSDHEFDGGSTELDESGNKGDRFVDRGDGYPRHARHARPGIVSMTASAMNPSVPSEPTRRRRKISSGVSPSRSAQSRNPWVFLIAYLRRVRSASAVSARSSFRSSSKPSASCGSASANSFSASGLDVSMTAPDGVTNVSAATVWYASLGTVHRMPPELFAITPPIVQAAELAGSGPSRRPCGCSSELTWPRIVPGRARTRLPPSSTLLPYQ